MTRQLGEGSPVVRGDVGQSFALMLGERRNVVLRIDCIGASKARPLTRFGVKGSYQLGSNVN